MNILFVCTGNVSRSFLAEKLLVNEVGSVHGIAVSSAGLLTFPGSPPDPKMLEYLNERGIPGGGHLARQIRAEDVQWADLILVMQKEHAEDLEGKWPEAIGKVKLLGTYISGVLEGDDIPDPYGRSAYHYRLVQSQIALAVKALAESLAEERPAARVGRRGSPPKKGEKENRFRR
jgi:protein-tyrosine phosphatase